jgi:hypothetical protein
MPCATAGEPHVFVGRWLETSNRLVLLVARLDIETSELLIRETGKVDWNIIWSALILKE